MDEAEGAVCKGGVWVAGYGGLDKIEGFGWVPIVKFINGAIDFFGDCE